MGILIGEGEKGLIETGNIFPINIFEEIHT